MITALAHNFLNILISAAIIGGVIVGLLGLWHVSAVFIKGTTEDIYRIISRKMSSRSLARRFKKIIRKHPHDYSVHILFETFAHFYELNFEREKSWELNRDTFPGGLSELTTWYLWIRTVREENMKLINEIIYDLNSGQILIYGHLYPSFGAKIDKYGRLHITPLEEGEEPSFLSYLTKSSKVYEMLNALDDNACTWILKNRKHFAF